MKKVVSKMGIGRQYDREVTYSPTYRRWGLLAQVRQPIQYQRAIPMCPTVMIDLLAISLCTFNS